MLHLATSKLGAPTMLGFSHLENRMCWDLPKGPVLG